MPRIEYADRGGDVRYCQSSRLAVTALPAVLVFAQVRTKDDRKDSEQRQSELWLAIKKNLTGEKGAEWFELNLRDTLVPGGTYGLWRFRAQVISGRPERNPRELMVRVNGEETPEAKLLLKTEWKEPIAGGTEVIFSGVRRSFTSQPFVLTFDVMDFDVLSRKASASSK